MSGFYDIHKLDDLIGNQGRLISNSAVEDFRFKDERIPGREINISDSMDISIKSDDWIDSMSIAVDKSFGGDSTIMTGAMPSLHAANVGNPYSAHMDPTTGRVISPIEEKFSEHEVEINILKSKIEFAESELIIKDAKINTLESLIAMLEPRVAMLELTKKDI